MGRLFPLDFQLERKLTYWVNVGDMIDEIAFAKVDCDFPIRRALFEHPATIKLES